jgi:hypothetical protein
MFFSFELSRREQQIGMLRMRAGFVQDPIYQRNATQRVAVGFALDLAQPFQVILQACFRLNAFAFEAMGADEPQIVVGVSDALDIDFGIVCIWKI